jgi:histidine triad (HIT) family protein
MTLFEKIIAREIPATIVHEDDSVIAFFTIEPFSLGHTLVVPKKSYRWFQDMPGEEFSEVMDIVQKIAKAQKVAFSCDFVHVEIMGEQVPHVHVHVYPEMFNVALGEKPNPLSYKSKEHEVEVAEKMKTAFVGG